VLKKPLVLINRFVFKKCVFLIVFELGANKIAILFIQLVFEAGQ